MSDGNVSLSLTLNVLAGSTARGTLALRSSHVCQLPKTLTFDSNRSFIEPTPENKAAFHDLITRLGTPSSHNRLLITGHTDSVGSPQPNQQLSLRRAQAVQAVLQGAPTGTQTWENLSSTEGWGTPELTLMVTEVGETDINPFRGAANQAARLGLYQRYFARLLDGRTVPSLTPTAPPLLACGKDQLLHGNPNSPSRDTSLPPIRGDFRPNRRSEFFFFDSAASTIACSEYPTWTGTCSLVPPSPTITVTIASIETVRRGGSANVQVTISPSPLPFGTQINLTLSTTSGTGEARFVSNNSITLLIRNSGPVTVRGITASSEVDNIRVAARVVGQSAVLAQEDFTVVDAVSIFLQFEVWNLTTRAFEPLPAGVAVDLMSRNLLLPNVRVDTAQTAARGRIFFNLPNLSASGKPNPDIFFLVHTNGRSHAGHTLPSEWSTKGWRAADGTPGFQPGFTGPSLGTPSAPVVFRVGLDFHARFQYRDLSPTLKTPPGPAVDAPAPQGIPVSIRAGVGSLVDRQTLRTDGNGEVHGAAFNIDAGESVFFNLDFSMEDAAINLPQARVPMDIPDQSGWNTFNSDAGESVFRNNDSISLGTQVSPKVFLMTANDRNAAMYMLKVLREWSIFLFRITGGAWTGVSGLTIRRSSISGIAFSFPVGTLNIPPSDHFNRETLTHELSHQIMWKEVNVSTLGIIFQATIGPLRLRHFINLFENETHALIEGWAEFMEAVFEGKSTPPFAVTALFDKNRTPAGTLGPPPPDNRGEKVEGAFANGLWAIFQNHVVTPGVAANPHVPESRGGNIMTTAAGTYLSNTAVRDRFLSMIWNPLKDLRPLLSPTTTAMLGNIRSRNLGVWHTLQPELQAFNMAMAVPTVSSISPIGGPPGGGTLVTLTGTEFTLGRTQVRIGGNPATNVVVANSTTLTAQAPPGPLGLVDVIVRTDAGDSAPLVGGFNYARAPVVSSVTVTGLPLGTPARGPMGQETSVTIRGTDFHPDAIVLIGGQPATGVVHISPTEITARSPRRRLPLPPGGVPVVLQNPDLQQGVLDPGFEYFLLPAPVLVDVIPGTGSFLASTPIRITGANFQSSDVLVFFDRIPSVPLPAVIDRATSSATVISAVTPGVPAPVSMDVRVENPDGQFDTKPGGFTYTP